MAVECIIVVNYWIEVHQLSASQVHTACFLSKGDGQRDYRLEDVNLHQIRSSHLLQLGLCYNASGMRSSIHKF